MTTSLAGIDKIQFFAEELVDQARLIYNGMTCAKPQMLITSTGDTVFTRALVQMLAPRVAASINALTELETVIGEMQGLGPGPKCLAGELDRLLLNYAMDEIISLIKQIPAEVE